MIRALLFTLLVAAACGSSRTPSQPAPPQGSNASSEPPSEPPPSTDTPSTDQPLSNVEPPTPDAAVDARPCPKQCMDICCEQDEICSHGRGPDDGTFPKCIRRHP